MNENDNDSDYGYGMNDLLADMDTLRKAGIIEVSGITDDGQWLFGMTDFGKSIYDKLRHVNPEAFKEVIESLLYINEQDDE